MCVYAFIIARQSETRFIESQQRKCYKNVTQSDRDCNLRSQTFEQETYDSIQVSHTECGHEMISTPASHGGPR